jgi:hypothetical protein
MVGVVMVASGAETRSLVAVRNQRLCLCLAVYDREVTGLTGMARTVFQRHIRWFFDYEKSIILIR